MIEQIVNMSHRMLEQSARVLARAFHSDPLFKHALPDEQHRGKRLTGLFARSLQYGIRFGEIYSVARQGLAIWLPPGNTMITLRRAFQAGMWLVPLKTGLQAVLRLGRMNNLSESLHKRIAPDPHWYLFLIGIDPASQGQGLGSLLLQPVLAKADAARLPCYLETNNPTAVRFYQKHGFSIAEEHHIPLPGFYLWAMRRESR